MNLPAWIKKARGNRSFNLFASEAGVSSGQIHGMEKGRLKDPQLSTLNRIASASEGRCLHVRLEIDPRKK